MTKEQLQSAVDALKWYHRVELPHGIVTPGWAPQFPEHYRLPDDLTGKRVLDVGAYDGYWTFECLKRGASSVLAIDNFTDTIHKGEKRSWAQFDLCAESLGYDKRNLYREESSIYDLDRADLEPFDIILFLGVLYHLKHPLLALERLRAVSAPGGMLMVESHICDDYSPYIEGGQGDNCVLEFYPDDQLGNNHTNWFGPTLRALQCMMRVAGFGRVEGWKIDSPDNLSQTRGYAHGFVIY